MRIPGTSRRATAPTMPHILQRFPSLSRFDALCRRHPAADVALARTADCEFTGVDFHRYGRSSRDISAVTHFDRRDQRRIRSDEHVAAEVRLVFRDAVVVAHDRAGADVAVRTGRGIAE